MEDQRFAVCAALADLIMAGTPGMAQDYSRAADLYDEAAEGAIEAGRPDRASKWMMKAEEARGMEE